MKNTVHENVNLYCEDGLISYIGPEKHDADTVIDGKGMLCGVRMRCEHSKLNTVRGLQAIGFQTIAFGDSYNDIDMIKASKAGFLFRTTEKIKKEHPEIPSFEEYGELLEAIKKAL